MGATTAHVDLGDAEAAAFGRSRGFAIAVAGGATVLVTSLAAAVLGLAPAASALTVAAMVPAAVVDVRERRLPDVWVALGLLVFVATTMTAWAAGTGPALGQAALGAAVLTGPILALHLVSPDAMGFGDVKAAAVLGLAVGSIDWRLSVVALTLAAGTAGAVGIAARLRTVPFGPFLVGGAWLAVLAADRWLAPWVAGGGIR